MDNSLVGYWYALGPSDLDFKETPEAFAVHSVIADTADVEGAVLVRNPGGEQFPVDREFIMENAFPPSCLEVGHRTMTKQEVKAG